MSCEELKKLKNLVQEAKMVGAGVVSALIKIMLERNMFLLGATGISKDSAIDSMNKFNEREKTCMLNLYEKLFPVEHDDAVQLENLIHTDLAADLEVDLLKKNVSEYAEAKELAIEEASKVADTQNIKHIAEIKRVIGDGVEKAAKEWNSQKEVFYQQIGYDRTDDDDDFGKELEAALLSDR